MGLDAFIRLSKVRFNKGKKLFCSYSEESRLNDCLRHVQLNIFQLGPALLLSAVLDHI